MVDEETTEKFRTSFAFDEKEKLLGCKFTIARSLLITYAPLAR